MKVSLLASLDVSFIKTINTVFFNFKCCLTQLYTVFCYVLYKSVCKLSKASRETNKIPYELKTLFFVYVALPTIKNMEFYKK